MSTLHPQNATMEDIEERIQHLPNLNPKHIFTMTNAVGILQHATYATPNYHHGYCLDDNARALLLAGMLQQAQPAASYEKLCDTYLAYLLYMQNENGTFHTFLSFSHQFLDAEGTEDSFGRSIWALGSYIKNESRPQALRLSLELFDRSFEALHRLQSIRSIAYALIGVVYLHKSQKSSKNLMPTIERLRQQLQGAYLKNAIADWNWFEEVLTYDNAILPYSLLLSLQVAPDPSIQEIALNSSYFLDSILFDDGSFATIGNTNWYKKGDKRSYYGQQPIEIPSTILWYDSLQHLTGDDQYAEKSFLAFDWFFGRNTRGVPLYDDITKGCSDGLEEHGVNLNQGAESTLSFWIAYLYIKHRTR